MRSPATTIRRLPSTPTPTWTPRSTPRPAHLDWRPQPAPRPRWRWARLPVTSLGRRIEPSSARLQAPQGQTSRFVHTSKDWYVADFAAARCALCPLVARCPAEVRKSRPVYVLRVTVHDVEIANRRQQIAANQAAGHNLRVAIESTIGTLKHPYPDDQLPVRGIGRVTDMMLASGLMVNVRRLWRYLTAKDDQTAETGVPTETSTESSDPVVSLSRLLTRLLSGLWGLCRRPVLAF